MAVLNSLILFMSLAMTTEQKHEIEILGLPEGYRAVEAMIDPDDAGYLGDDGNLYIQAKIKLEKIKPRSIKVADTGEVRQPKEGEYVFNNGNLCLCRKPERWGNEHQIWRVVEEE